jgi:hypothetical protein
LPAFIFLGLSQACLGVPILLVKQALSKTELFLGVSPEVTSLKIVTVICTKKGISRQFKVNCVKLLASKG